MRRLRVFLLSVSLSLIVPAAAQDTIGTASDSTFEGSVLKSPLPVIVFYWFDSCRPCLSGQPALEEIARDFRGKIKIVKFDAGENVRVPERYGIVSVPAYILFKKGQIDSRQVGIQSKQQLEEWLRSRL